MVFCTWRWHSWPVPQWTSPIFRRYTEKATTLRSLNNAPAVPYILSHNPQRLFPDWQVSWIPFDVILPEGAQLFSRTVAEAHNLQMLMDLFTQRCKLEQAQNTVVLGLFVTEICNLTKAPARPSCSRSSSPQTFSAVVFLFLFSMAESTTVVVPSPLLWPCASSSQNAPC